MKKRILIMLLTLALAVAMVIPSTVVLAADPAPPFPGMVWPKFHNDLALTGYSPSYAPNGANVVWNTNTGASVEASPVVAYGMVYVGNLAGQFRALDARTGAVNWTFTIADVPIHSTAAVVNGVVYFLAENGNLYARDALTGAAIWARFLGDGPWDWSSPAVKSGYVFVATSNGYVHKVNAETGVVAWSKLIGGSPNSAITVANGRVYSGTHNMGNTSPTLVALRESDGLQVWTYNYNTYHGGVAGMINCNGAAVVGGRVYFGVYNWGGVGPQAVALNEANGAEIWATSINGNSTSTPAVYSGRVYIGSDDGQVYALNASNGAVVWSFATGAPVWAAPAVADGKVFFGSLDHWFYAVRLNGTLAWKYDTGTSRLMSSPAVANSRVFVGNENGKVYAFSGRLVGVDIKPGSDPNSINLNNKGVIPVAILGSATFDVTDINVSTLRFGPAWATNALEPSYEDVNLDGYMDLVTHYPTQETGIMPGQTMVGIRGFTNSGMLFEGGDDIRTVPEQ